MFNCCTLFDSNFLSRGIAMYESLKKHCEEFHIYIFAFDDKTFELLSEMNLEHASVISLDRFEDEELLKVKPHRSKSEYAWTCAGSTILYVLQNFNVESCTYLDADIYFFSSPEELIEELGDKSTLITEHRYTDRYDMAAKSGKYCVQFITFKNNPDGLKALKWWRDACLQWCYARFEEDRFGDQKYLDDWTEKFDGVHVLEHPGGGVAPWNVQQYDIFTENGKLYGIEITTIKKFPLVFYHAHELRFYAGRIIQLTGLYMISNEVKELIYKPYIMHLENINQRIIRNDNDFTPHEKLHHYPITQESSNKMVNTAKIFIAKSIIIIFKIFSKIKLAKVMSRLNLYRIDEFIKDN